jgi:hypothetical protein
MGIIFSYLQSIERNTMCCVDVLRRGAFQSHGINYRRFTRVLRFLREALRFLRVLITRGGDGLKRTRLLLFFGLIGARLNKIGVLFLRVGTTIGSSCERFNQRLGSYIYILCIFNNRNGISRKSRINSLLGRWSKILTTTIP